MDIILQNLASRWKRLIAYLIDIQIVIIIVFGFYYLFLGMDEAFHGYFERDDPFARIKFIALRNQIRFLSFLIWILLCLFFEASNYQGSFGKQLMGIIVIDEQGERISLTKSIVRNLSKILSYVVFTLGFLWILFDKKRQGWHDKISKTYVVNDNKFDQAMLEREV